MRRGQVLTRRISSPEQVIVVLSLTAFAISSIMRIPDPLLPEIARSFGATIGEASIIVSAFVVCYSLLQVVFGPIGDRVGKLKIIAGAALACAVATGACAGAQSLASLTVLRGVSGAFAAGIIPLALAYIGDTIEYERRQSVIARFLFGQIFGLVAGQALGGFLGETLGWRPVFLVLALVLLVASLTLIAALLRAPEVERTSLLGEGAEAGRLVHATRRILAAGWPRTVLAAVLLEGGVMFGAFAFIGSDLHDRFGLGYGAVGVLLALFGLGGFAFAANARRLIAGLGETGLARLGGLLLLAGYLLLAAVPSLAAVVIAIPVIGVGFYMLHTTLQAHGTQMTTEARGIGVALFASALFLGQSIGVTVAAPVMDAHGARPIYLFAGAGLFVVALWFAGQIKRRPAV